MSDGPRVRSLAEARRRRRRREAERDELDAAQLYDLYSSAVRGYMRSHGARDVDDLVGEVFLRVAQSIGRFSGDADDARRWVFTIAHHTLVDRWRRDSVRPVAATGEVPDIPSVAPPWERLERPIVAAVLELTPEQREVVVLRFVADLSLEDVAAITGRPVGAVKSMQARALARLQSRLQTEGSGVS